MTRKPICVPAFFN